MDITLSSNLTKINFRRLVCYGISNPGSTYGSLLGHLPSVAGNRLSDESGVVAGVATVALDEVIHINAGDEVFFSALFTFDDSAAGNRLVRVSFIDDVNGDELSFGKAAVGVRGVSIRANTAATGRLITDGADNSFSDGQTLWLIGRYFNSAVSGRTRWHWSATIRQFPRRFRRASTCPIRTPNLPFPFLASTSTLLQSLRSASKYEATTIISSTSFGLDRRTPRWSFLSRQA